MTDEELQQTVEDFYKMFPDAPNFEQEPRRFAAYVKMYKHLKTVWREDDNTTTEAQENI